MHRGRAPALVLDQASKYWLVRVFDIARHGTVKITPFFDLVLAWNSGISFGWFQSDGTLAQIVLMLIKAVAVVVLAVWMARSRTLLATLALGLIIGGAVGNAIDRFAYGAVVDFALFHVQIGGNTFNWYVFNLADVAIVAGVAALLYELVLGNTRRKSALIPANISPLSLGLFCRPRTGTRAWTETPILDGKARCAERKLAV